MNNLAYAQVYQLLQYIPQSEYERIPKEQALIVIKKDSIFTKIKNFFSRLFKR